MSLRLVRTVTSAQWQPHYKPLIWSKVMGLSGLPSLLALAGLLGFALMELILTY